MTAPKPLPLSVGLLVSAMARHNHALFAPWCESDPLSKLLGPPTVRITKAMEDVLKIYDALAIGQPCDPQVSEEFLGKGYYSPERETHYASALEPYDLKDLAIEMIVRRTSRPS